MYFCWHWSHRFMLASQHGPHQQTLCLCIGGTWEITTGLGNSYFSRPATDLWNSIAVWLHLIITTSTKKTGCVSSYFQCEKYILLGPYTPRRQNSRCLYVKPQRLWPQLETGNGNHICGRVWPWTGSELFSASLVPTVVALGASWWESGHSL